MKGLRSMSNLLFMKSKQKNITRHKITMNCTSICKTKFVVFLILIILIPVTSVEAENLRLFRIGTGGQTGVYYPIGKIIAQAITCNDSIQKSVQSGENGVPGCIGVAQNSAGSIDNVRSIAAGDIEAGLIQADVASWAFKADHVFKGNEQVQAVRAIASLYPEKFQIVTRSDANIQKVTDLRGKRISNDEIGSGTLAVMRIVLDAHGMTENDFLSVYLKPVFTRDKMISGELQGFVMMAGAPMEAVSQLSDIEISLVPISQEIASQIEARYPYLVPGHIPADVYPGIPEVATIEVYALLVVSKTMDESLVYQITETLWSQRTLSMLKEGHPQGKFITPETALTGVSIPLHPGAEKYYMEHSNRFKYFQPK